MEPPTRVGRGEGVMRTAWVLDGFRTARWILVFLVVFFLGGEGGVFDARGVTRVQVILEVGGEEVKMRTSFCLLEGGVAGVEKQGWRMGEECSDGVQKGKSACLYVGSNTHLCQTLYSFEQVLSLPTQMWSVQVYI